MPRLVHDDLFMGYYGSLTTILWNGNDYPHLTEDKIDLREIMELVRGHVTWKWLSWDLELGLTHMFRLCSQYLIQTKPLSSVCRARPAMVVMYAPVHKYVLRHTVWSPRHPLYWCVEWRSLKTIFWDSKQEKENTKEAKTWWQQRWWCEGSKLDGTNTLAETKNMNAQSKTKEEMCAKCYTGVNSYFSACHFIPASTFFESLIL